MTSDLDRLERRLLAAASQGAFRKAQSDLSDYIYAVAAAARRLDASQRDPLRTRVLEVIDRVRRISACSRAHALAELQLLHTASAYSPPPPPPPLRVRVSA